MSITTHASPSRYLPVAGWEQLPDGWLHPDVPGVAVDALDRVYLFTRGSHPVIVYEANGTFITSWGEGVFNNPHAIRIDHEGFAWCVDNGDHTVRKCTLDGEVVMMLGTPGMPSDTGVRTRGADYTKFDYRDVTRGGAPFNGPTDVCVLRDGTVFVSDGYGNARVHRFSPAGGLELSWGQPGSGPGQFHIPHAIIATPDEQQLLVADRENNRIQIFDLDGELVDIWEGWCRPDGFAISRDELLCVTQLGLLAGRWDNMDPLTDESPGSRCILADFHGREIERWGTDDPTEDGSFFAPHGAAFDSTGALYVGEVSWSGGVKTGIAPLECHTLQKFVRP